MTKFFCLALAIAAFSSQTAWALTTDGQSTRVSSAAAPLNDPDENRPRLVVGPSNMDEAGRSPIFGSVGPVMPSIRDNGPGANAFENAFAHQNDDR